MGDRLLLPGVADDANQEEKATAQKTTSALIALDEFLGEIDDEEVRAHVPVLLVRFMAANIAADAVGSGWGIPELRIIRQMLLDGVAEGWAEGIAAAVGMRRPPGESH